MATEAELKSMLEGAPLPAYVFRTEGEDFVLTFANADARAKNPILEKLVGTSLVRLYQHQPEAIEDARRCVATKSTVQRETIVRRHDRLEANQHILLVFTFVEPHFVVIFFRDVAEDAPLRAAYRESEERYQSVIASLPTGFLLRDREGRVLACNEIAARICGSRVADMIGRPLDDRVRVETLDGRPVGPDGYPGMRAIASGSPERAIHRAVMPDGRERWLHVSAAPVRGSDGQMLGSVTILSDETDRVRSEREVAASEAKLRMTLAAARMSTFVWVPELNYGEWSPETSERFAIPQIVADAGTLSGFLRWVHPDDQARIAKVGMELAAAPDRARFDEEMRLVGEDGVTRWARASGSVERQETARIVGTLMDVTERHALVDQLEEAQRLESIGRLAGGLAHDFNNMLAAMLGSVELLDPVVPDGSRIELETIRHGAERAKELTAQLLSFARRRPVELVPLDLGALVRRVEPLLARLALPPITLRVETPRPVWIRGDAAQIEQVVVNLVVNGRDAMPDGGTLVVRVDAEDGRAVLEVMDEGPGMDAATRARAFEPFFTTKAAGTGLGLASSYGVVRQHGGDIALENRAERKGLVVVVSLPLVDRVSDAPRTPAALPTSLRGTALVVDDEPLVRMATGRVLQSLGFDVLTASGGSEAEAHLAERAGEIAIVVCDVVMPERSGPEVVRALRERCPELRVLFVSGYSEVDVGPVGPRTGFLTKPYQRDELARRLGELLSL